MAKDTLDNTDELLEEAIEIIDDDDAIYKVRSARQMLVLAKERQNN